MTSWLSKQRKQALIDLANEAGMKSDGDMRKDELIDALDEHLQKNSTGLTGLTAFEPYYGTRRTPGRPRESGGTGGVTSDEGGEVKSVVRGRGKRPTKVKSEPEEGARAISSPTQALTAAASRILPSSATTTTRTPAARRVSRPESLLPASPAVVADEIEQATTRFYAGLDDMYSVSGVPQTVEWVRDLCSSAVGVHATFLLLEAYALQKAIFPYKYAFDIPAVPLLHTPSIAVKVPDLFVLLSGAFWGPTLLWTATSIFVPLFFAYFYNMTAHPLRRSSARVQALRYPYDPMTFSIVKALATLLVYRFDITRGYIDPYPAITVDHAMFSGHSAILTGCAISGLASLWEASQH